MDLLSSELKTFVEDYHRNLYETYQRQEAIRFYHKAKERIVYNPQYHANFDDLNGNENIKEPVYRDIICCIITPSREELLKFIPGEDSQVRFKMETTRMRVQIKAEDYDWAKETEAFFYLGDKYRLESPWRGIGPFGTFIFYEAYLQKVN